MRRILIAAALSAAASLPAQTVVDSTAISRTQKVFIIAGPSGSAINLDGNDEIEGGSGITLGLGYGITRHLGLFVETSFANLDADQGTSMLAHIDFGTRFHFANPTRQWIPFLDAALTGLAIVRDDALVCDVSGCATRDVTMTGAAFSFGGGVLYYAMPKLAIGGTLRFTTGEFTDVEIDNSISSPASVDMTSTRFQLGVVWFPGR